MVTLRLWDRIGIDHLGPSVASEPYGNRYLIVATDHFSKWIFLKPIKTKETDEVAFLLLEDIICRVGCFRVLLSDRGKEFTSGVITDLCRFI
jgi:hypothetical protein